MSRVAIVAMGISAHEYVRAAEQGGNRKNLFDETWAVNGFGHVFDRERMFHMDDIRLQYLRGKNGNKKIGRLVEYLRTAEGPVYTSRVLTDEPPSEELLHQLRNVIQMLPEGDERKLRERELMTLEAERELIEGGGFKGLVAFPLQDVLRDFRCHPHFDNTVAYAIALAAHEGHDMTLYGADFDYPGMPAAEKGRSCCEFWVGQAVARGLDVDITRQSTLMNANKAMPLYGYDGVEIDGSLDSNDNICIKMMDRPLPSPVEVEMSYYKGPPGQFDQWMAHLRAQP